MPITYTDSRATFSGNCKIDEAEGLRAHLERYPNAEVEMTSCEQIHTTILQILIAAQTPVIAPPTNVFLLRCLSPYLKQPGNSSPE
ncbi:MAG: hypothetical protein V4443_09085 [Pseudomonadota bacterium]